MRDTLQVRLSFLSLGIAATVANALTVVVSVREGNYWFALFSFLFGLLSVDMAKHWAITLFQRKESDPDHQRPRE